jgi:hypothetical protein
MLSNLLTNFTNYGINKRTYRRAMRGLREVFNPQRCIGLLSFFNTKIQMENWELLNGYTY